MPTKIPSAIPCELYEPHRQIYAALITLFQAVEFYRLIPQPGEVSEGDGETPDLFQSCADRLAQDICKVHKDRADAARSFVPVAEWFQVAAAPLALPEFRYKSVGRGKKNLATCSFHELGLLLCDAVVLDLETAVVLDGKLDSLDSLLNRDSSTSLQPAKILRGLQYLKVGNKRWDLVERLAIFQSVLFARLRQEFLCAWRAKVPEANVGLLPADPPFVSGEGSKAMWGELKARECLHRDLYFSECYDRGTKPAQIRDHWNTELDETSRKKICRYKNENRRTKIEPGTKGIAVVKSALKLIKKTLKESSERIGSIAAPKSP